MSKLEDQQALRDLMARYIDAVSRDDEAAWGATWAEDGRWSLAGNDVEGRDNIVALWRQLMGGFEFAVMLPSSSLFEIDGDSATGHWYLQEFTRDNDGNTANLLSRYRDSYSRVDGQWLYQSRDYEIMYFGPADLSGSFTPLSAGS